MMHTSIWDEMRRMQQRMDELFGRAFGGSDQPLLEHDTAQPLVESSYRSPTTDMWETEKEVIAEIELPGVDKEDIEVEVTDDAIHVQAQRSDERKDEDAKSGSYRYERTYSGYRRTFALPTGVDASKASASHKNGVLRISVPKTGKESTERKLLPIK